MNFTVKGHHFTRTAKSISFGTDTSIIIHFDEYKPFDFEQVTLNKSEVLSILEFLISLIK